MSAQPTPQPRPKPKPKAKPKTEKPQKSRSEESQEATSSSPVKNVARGAPKESPPLSEEGPPVSDPSSIENAKPKLTMREKFKDLPKMAKPSKKKYLNMLIYGDAGVGKTTLAGSAQADTRMADTLVADIEAGSLSLANNPEIDTIPITSYSQFARLYDWLRMYCRARDAKNLDRMIKLELLLKEGQEDYDEDYIKKHPKSYKTFVIDSLTEVQKLCMYHLLGVNVGLTELDLPPDSPEFKEWGQSAEMIRLLIRTFRSLPMNVIFVCAEHREQDERKRVLAFPALPGKLKGEVQGFIDVVARFVSKERGGEAADEATERRIYLRPSERYQAKDRYHIGNTVKYIRDPTLQKFLDIEE